MKPPLKIAFADFWPNFDPYDNYLTNLLTPHFDLEHTAEPDFLIFSCFGQAHHQYSCIKIFYTAENVRPDFGVCDYAFSFDFLDRPEHFRLPQYAWYEPERLVKRAFDPERVLAEKTRFCNFVV